VIGWYSPVEARLKLSSLAIALLAAVSVLGAAYTVSLVRQPADLLVVQAATSTFRPVRTAALWALDRLPDCPYADFLPTTPFGFAVSAWQDADHDARLERVLALLDRLGCDIDRRGLGGLTALHSAVLFNNAEAVQALRRLGADPSVPTDIRGRGESLPLQLDASAFAAYLDRAGGENRSAVYTALAGETADPDPPQD